jgi:hypothetical protein
MKILSSTIIAISTFVMTALSPTGTASAQSGQADLSSNDGRAAKPIEGFHLQPNPGWSLGLESYAGLAVLATGDGTRGHGIVGGLSRLRLKYFEMGARLEVSDLATVRWQQVGGFVGAYLPITNWVDIDTTVGLAQRTYLSPDVRYGAGGMDVHDPAITLRLGFSDRPVDGLFGLRVGAALLVDIDLKHSEAAWTYNPDGRNIVTGTTAIGGASVGLVICLGLDVAFRRPPRPVQPSEHAVEFGSAY